MFFLGIKIGHIRTYKFQTFTKTENWNKLSSLQSMQIIYCCIDLDKCKEAIDNGKINVYSWIVMMLGNVHLPSNTDECNSEYVRI